MHSVLLDADGRTNAEASASHCETQKKKKEEKREKKKKPTTTPSHRGNQLICLTAGMPSYKTSSCGAGA
jgi:hypothetical protein